MQPTWITFAITLAASLVLTPAARALARRFKVVDHPDGERKLQKSPVPLWGGVAVYLSLVLGLLAARFSPLSSALGFADLSLALIAAAGFVCLLGCVDDSRDLNARFKLLLQIASVLPVVLAGYFVDRIVVFGQPIELGWLGIPLTVIWLVGCINALNLLDGMDGLAATVGVSTAGIMAIIATAMGNDHVAVIAIALAGALAGFLVYNLPPASIYLGDSGSMVIGLVVGILGIQGSLKTTATLSITAPAVVMSIPMLDTVFAILRRKLTGRSFAAPDRGHIHHRLLDRGLSSWQALCVIGVLCLTTGAAATAATLLRSDALAWIVMCCLVVLLVRTRAFGHYELSLLKLRVASVLTRCGQRLLASNDSQKSALFAGKCFETDWGVLTRQASKSQATQIWLSLSRAGRPRGFRRWSLADDAQHAIRLDAAENVNHWSLAVRFGRDDAEIFECRVSGYDSQTAQPWYLPQLADLLRKFAAHWASRLDEIPTALSFDLPEASQQRKAA